MSKMRKHVTAMCVSIAVMTSCGGGKTTEQCKDDIRAYEFGREMQGWTALGGGGSLREAIEESSTGLGIDAPYDANNDCVKRGFSDAQSGKESPFNPEGKSWNSF